MENEIKASSAATELAAEFGINLADVEHEGDQIVKPDVSKHLAGLDQGDESADEVLTVKCKACGVSRPPVINNRKEARCEACYELLPVVEG